LKEVLLCNARDTYLFDCRVAGEDSQTLRACREVLDGFIRFTGNVLVKELTPDHVRLYIANLSDGPNEGEEHIRMVISHYAIIRDWIRWLYVQKFLARRNNRSASPPRLMARRSSLKERSISAAMNLYGQGGWRTGR
jgi:hypothetical protein